MGIIGHWFKKRRATALGLIAIGSSTGGTIFPIVFSNLVNKIGYAFATLAPNSTVTDYRETSISFQWTMRVFAFIILAALGFANVVLERRLPPINVSGGLANFRQFRNIAYTLYTAAGFISFLGLYTRTLFPCPQ